MIITLTLNPSIDYILQVPEIRMEDTLRANHAFFQAGGKGINVSRVLTRLGVSNVAWGFCGGDTGKWLTGFLDQHQVRHDFATTAVSTRINAILTDQSTHKQLRVSAPGGEVQEHEEHALLDRFNRLPADVAWVVMGGSMPPGITPRCMRQLIERANAQQIPCVLDADGDVLREGLQGRPYLIKPNQYELERLLGKPVSTPAEMVAGARDLIAQGLVQIVVTSLAEAGAVLITRDEVISGKAPKVPVVSKVGAGDSMVAGLVKGLLEKAPLADILRMGIAAGTAAVMTPGNELCQPRDYEVLFNQVEIQVPAVF